MIFTQGSNWDYMKQPLCPPLPSFICINMESDAGIFPKKEKIKWKRQIFTLSHNT